uniref:AvrM14-A n=1 Tax=Melampsora lini TaxID=5261 RepID=A0A1B2CW89_MELLI|nr:AvrM14-A [Melampsora lini]
MKFGIIFLALFFVTISHVLCAGNNDLKNVKAIAIVYRELSDGSQTVLLAKMKGLADEKGWMFVRGHVREDEEADPGVAAIRETQEETGFTGMVKKSGAPFTQPGSKDTQRVITIHPHIVQVQEASKSKDTEDTVKRQFLWVHPSEVRSKLQRAEMIQAWDQLHSFF